MSKKAHLRSGGLLDKLRNMQGQPYVSTKDESVRMFKSDFMEFFSHVHPVTPFLIYLPLVGYLLFVAFAKIGLSLVVIGALFLGGIAIWTLFEYVMHRFAFHYEPKSRWGKQLHFLMHGVHHDYPNDSRRLVMPPVVSIPIALIMYLVFAAIFGRFTPALFGGFLFGYLCYDCIHYATHHFAVKNRALLWLRQYHLRHHFKDDTVQYGVSSPLWDYIFGTGRK